MSIEFKSDADYGYRVELQQDRELPEGHHGFGFSPDDTEVDVLKKTLDAYLDVSSIESIMNFHNHKLDFSISFIDSMVLMLSEKKVVVQKYLDEVNSQLEAVNHRMIKPYIDGQTLTKEDKLSIYDMQEKLLVERRGLKDSVEVLRVYIENLEKSRNFILGMNLRKYTPKTNKFKPDESYHLGSTPKVTPSDTNIKYIGMLCRRDDED